MLGVFFIERLQAYNIFLNFNQSYLKKYLELWADLYVVLGKKEGKTSIIYNWMVPLSI